VLRARRNGTLNVMVEHQWWYWALAALLAVGLEVVLGTSFVFIFFALAALVTALTAALALTPEFWQSASLFGGLSVTFLALVGRPAWQRRSGSPQIDTIDAVVGSMAVVQQAMGPGARGQVALHGTTWMAQNQGSQSLPEGISCRVVAVINLTLVVHGDIPGDP
jgi:membrane protein implicated in regulation of membrane protease activity